VQALGLNDNTIGDTGAAALAGVLPRCATLRVLGLQGNRISGRVKAALREAQARSPSLRTLNL